MYSSVSLGRHAVGWLMNHARSSVHMFVVCMSLLCSRSAERHEYYERSVRTENMHDFHYPDPLGPPNPTQPCAKLLKGTQNMWYCANGYPRDLVCEPCEQSVAQDALRPDLWRCNLCRNCPLMNSHAPVVGVGLQSNSDAQPVLTRHQAEMYCCKYCAKHSKRLGTRCALFDILDELESKDAYAKDQFGESFEQSKLGTKLHKAFMAEIGEEMCQAEVAHHANRCPEYFCSRPTKNVHLYKKALALAKQPRRPRAGEEEWDDWEQWEGEGIEAEGPAGAAPAARRRVKTQVSDLELYERRTWYWFWPYGAARPSPYLPWRETPEEQLEHMSVYEFFRFVQYHGGRAPYLTWHDPDGNEPSRMPIVMMSPAIKLREGPGFEFGARWALMQHHPWVDRLRFLDMEGGAVKTYFRQWVEGSSEEATPVCPWYVVEQYERENSVRLRGTRTKPPGSREAQPSSADGGEPPAHRGRQAQPSTADGGEEVEPRGDEVGEEENEEWGQSSAKSETEESSSRESAHERTADTRVLKMLYEGNMAEVNRREEQQRKSWITNHKHDFYRQTRCTSTAQEECSAMPAGVMNTHEDSDDEDAFGGEQKEISKEMQELRAAEHWVNQEGWDAAGEGVAVSSTGAPINLRSPGIGENHCEGRVYGVGRGVLPPHPTGFHSRRFSPLASGCLSRILCIVPGGNGVVYKSRRPQVGLGQSEEPARPGKR